MSEENAVDEAEKTPREVMIPLLSKWTGADETMLAQRDTEELRDYFQRAADPKACLMGFGAATVFAGGAVASFMARNYYAAFCLAASAILDGVSSVYCYRQNAEVAAELKKIQPRI